MSDLAPYRAAADRPFVDVLPDESHPDCGRCSIEFGNAVAARIASAHGLSVERLKGKGRLPDVVEARRELFEALRSSGWDYPRIGAFVGGRHHTTVMAALGAAHKERRRNGSR